METPLSDSDSDTTFLATWYQAERQKGLHSVHLSLTDPRAPLNASELRSELVSLIKAPTISDPELF